LLGVENLDIDLATSASPDIVVDLFAEAEVQTVGKQFGVVLIDGIEVATYRGERYDTPGKPLIHGVGSFEEDASRRDFTIYAMAMDQEGRILDPFGGQADLEQKLIRTVGNPALRFMEDPVRIIRGIGFAVRFGFSLEAETKNAMSKHKEY
jgi:tRNA nucleotidyltransferase/poly(A) polymerase